MQMTLGELIAALRRKDQDAEVRFDFVYFRPSGKVHSYRGYYEQLALDYTDEYKEDGVTVAKLLATLEAANGKDFYGYKGGEYIMHEKTPVWVAKHNESGGTAIVDVNEQDGIVRLITKVID